MLLELVLQNFVPVCETMNIQVFRHLLHLLTDGAGQFSSGFVVLLLY